MLTYQTNRPLPDGTLRPIRISYRGGQGPSAGETAVFIPGMVVPAAGWSPLFLGLATALAALLLLPQQRRGGPSAPCPIEKTGG